jgi:hypothetical protein
MKSINLKDKSRSPKEIIRLLRDRSSGEIYIDPWFKYASWISENEIEAYINDYGSIDFINDEDLTAFKLKFGI